jgi:hypothetical protein
MPDLYGNPVVSGRMTPHGNEALTQGTQEIDDRYYAEQKYIQSKKAFESLFFLFLSSLVARTKFK